MIIYIVYSHSFLRRKCTLLRSSWIQTWPWCMQLHQFVFFLWENICVKKDSQSNQCILKHGQIFDQQRNAFKNDCEWKEQVRYNLHSSVNFVKAVFKNCAWSFKNMNNIKIYLAQQKLSCYLIWIHMFSWCSILPNRHSEFYCVIPVFMRMHI